MFGLNARKKMEKKIYSGIGSRTAPKDILIAITDLAKWLAAQGYTGRSGGADGSDKAFQRGAEAVNGDFELYRPKYATKESIELASKFHPAWHNCNDYARKLHGRNAQIVLGYELDSPVSIVYCWTPGGKTIGGTGMGIRIAEHYKIDIKNLYDPKVLQEVLEMIAE